MYQNYIYSSQERLQYSSKLPKESNYYYYSKWGYITIEYRIAISNQYYRLVHKMNYMEQYLGSYLYNYTPKNIVRIVAPNIAIAINKGNIQEVICSYAIQFPSIDSQELYQNWCKNFEAKTGRKFELNLYLIIDYRFLELPQLLYTTFIRTNLNYVSLQLDNSNESSVYKYTKG